MKFYALVPFLLLLSVGEAFACANHGGPNFGAFSRYHPISQRQTPVSPLADLKVIHSRKAVIETNSKEDLQFDYVVPFDYSQAQVTLSASSKIEILQESPVALSEATGQFNMSYRALEPGVHYILVKITANKSNSTRAKIQRISIVSS